MEIRPSWAWVAWWAGTAALAGLSASWSNRGVRGLTATALGAAGAWWGVWYVVEIGWAGVVPLVLWTFAVVSWFAWVVVVEDHLT